MQREGREKTGWVEDIITDFGHTLGEGLVLKELLDEVGIEITWQRLE